MLEDARRVDPDVATRLRQMLEQAQRSLDAAAVGVHADAEGALDDILAARLLLSTALAVLDAEGNEV